MITNEVVEMAEELRDILGRVVGVEGVEEGFVLQYMCKVKEEKDKASVERVAEMLTEQANKKQISLEITVATSAEIEDARKRLEALMREGN